ncbi:MAG: hypothetical protein K2Q06_05610, partial [Parvularculaceae bacterium]|nr:hypothetical protein [Parvularculaceae bacterium]
MLHVGNIANNAYNNACIQRQWGVEADVLALDEYHATAAPEWEDGDLSRPLENPARADWSKAGVRGFQRPDWFVQGPFDPCLRYLLARRGAAKGARLRRLALDIERHLVVSNSAAARLARAVIRWRTNRTPGDDGVTAGAILLQYAGGLAQKIGGRLPLIGGLARRVAARLKAAGQFSVDNSVDQAVDAGPVPRR